MANIKKGDEVVIVGGKYNGFTGKVQDDPSKNAMVTVKTEALGPVHGILSSKIRKV